MGGKDFSNINTKSIYDAIGKPDPAEEAQKIPRKAGRAPLTDEELQLARETNQTQGRKGATSKRINMAFSPEVYDFVTTMARVRGESITKFTNHIFEMFMQDPENREIYEQAKAFRDKF